MHGSKLIYDLLPGRDSKPFAFALKELLAPEPMKAIDALAQAARALDRAAAFLAVAHREAELQPWLGTEFSRAFTETRGAARLAWDAHNAAQRPFP